jgi:hypothetical protein
MIADLVLANNERKLKFKRKTSHETIGSLPEFDNIEEIHSEVYQRNMDKHDDCEISSLLNNLQESTDNGSANESEEILSILRNDIRGSQITVKSMPLRPKVSMKGRVLHSEKNVIQRLNSLPNPLKQPQRVTNPFAKNFEIQI